MSNTVRVAEDHKSIKLTPQESSTAFDPPNLKIPGPVAQPHVATNSQRPTGFSFKSAQIWENFCGTNATIRSISPRSTKPKNFKTKNGCTCPHAKPRSFKWPQLSPSNLCKSTYNFRKPTIPWSSTALDQQNPKQFEIKKTAKCLQRRQRSQLQFHAPIRATLTMNTLPLAHTLQPFPHVCSRSKRWRAPQFYDVMDDVSWPGLTN